MKRCPPAAMGGVLGGKITGLLARVLYKCFATPSLNGQVFRDVRKDANRNFLCNSKIPFALKNCLLGRYRGDKHAAWKYLDVAQGPHTINLLESDILFHVDRDNDNMGFINQMWHLSSDCRRILGAVWVCSA